MTTNHINSFVKLLNELSNFAKNVECNEFDFEIETNIEEEFVHIKFETKELSFKFKEYYKEGLTKFFSDERYASYELKH